MPRRAICLVTLIVGLLAAVLLPASAASAGVDDFSYSSWTSTYDVSLDDEGRAVAHITETVVAEFPDFDQNKGIVRGYIERFEQAGLDLRILSVKDADGEPVPYETESDDGTLFVLTGTDDYVHGPQTYVIESEMHDFMITGTQSGNDEFYWNLLPLVSTQDIGHFRADITFSPELADALTGDVACYSGAYGQTTQCTVSGPVVTESGATFSIESGPRPAGDGVTPAIGFTAGTVTQPLARTPDPVADWGAPVLAVGTLLSAAFPRIAVAVMRRRRRKATGIVVAQFDVPADMPPLVASAVVHKNPNPVPAQIVHLAVNGALRLEDEADGGKRPVVRRMNDDAATHRLDVAMMSALFPGKKTLRKIPKSSNSFANRMRGLVEQGRADARRRGWLMKKRSPVAIALSLVTVALFIATAVLFATVVRQDRDSLPFSIIAVIAAFIIMAITTGIGFKKYEVLSYSGAEQQEYMLGVKEFIRVAEADRLQMLQSYQGAERRADGSVDVVHLYEKLLPYAMLLGEEKSWAKVLQTRYEQDSAQFSGSENSGPTWVQVRSTAALSSQLSGYSAKMQSAALYTPPSSSSGGGSTGGGFSGGGGGGGFSGGR